MSLQQVKVRIEKKTGKVLIEAEGFTGESCECLNELEQSLGIQLSKTDKDEKYQHVLPDPAFINT